MDRPMKLGDFYRAQMRALQGGTVPNNITFDAAAGYDPPWPMRLWRRLGFRMARATRDIEDDAEERARADGFVPGYLITRTVATIDWRDRLRLLVSGRLEVEVATQTDVLVRKSRSSADIGVLPPGKEPHHG